jgi:hypothetical protein
MEGITTFPEGTFYTDSAPQLGIDPEAAQEIHDVVFHPRFGQKWLQPHVASMLDSMLVDGKSKLKSEIRQKSFATNTVFGPNGLLFAVCENMDFGYGLFPNNGDEVLLNWLGPTMYLLGERLIFKIMNWGDYVRNTGARGSSAVWNCTPKVYAGFVAETGCQFDYCFDHNRHYSIGVPGGLTPNDFADVCQVQPQINILGTRVSDIVQLREFVLARSMKEHMLDTLFTGDWTAATVGNNGQEDGVIPWFANFLTRHAELTGACATAFGPKTFAMPTTAAALTTYLGRTIPDTPADILVAQQDALILRVSTHIEQSEWLLGDIDSGIELNFSDIAVLMAPEDAMCINWLQFCDVFCAGTTFTVSSRAEADQFYTDFQTRFRTGLYGGGTMRLRDGRQVSIMPLRRIPRGTAVVLIRGWGGSSPNPYAFRVAAAQYSQWYSAMRRGNPLTASQYRLLMNGTAVRIDPSDACSDIEVRWNQRLFSNAPWLQLLITGIPACAEVPTRSTWPAMPALAGYVRCTAN